MNIPPEFNSLPFPKKKAVLYKFAEIYSNDDSLLKFIDSLDEEQLNFACNFIFTKDNSDREKLRESEKKKLWQTITDIDFLNQKLSKIQLEYQELKDDDQNSNELLDIENELFNCD